VTNFFHKKNGQKKLCFEKKKGTFFSRKISGDSWTPPWGGGVQDPQNLTLCWLGAGVRFSGVGLGLG